MRAQVIVVGLGAMGSATCLALARRGVGVLGIDAHVPPHAFGSTHGGSRITRLAIGEGPEYMPLVRRSHELWRELEGQTGASLLTQCGGLILARPTSPFFEHTCALAREHRIAHERLDNAELRRRFAMFAVDEATEAYLEPSAGYVRPEAAVRAQLELADRLGAQLRLGERVREWGSSEGGVSVITDSGRVDADQLVLCAGAWLPQLLPEARELFAVYRQLMFWYAWTEGYEEMRDMPVWVWDFGGDRPEFVHLVGFYGFPALDGPGGGVKLGTELYEMTTVPDARQHPADRGESERIYRDYVRDRLPWLSPEPLRSASCLYTSTRGNRFVIDHHPEHDNVVIVSACSGHGFKHSPAIGEAVATWLAGGAGAADAMLEPFAFGRARQ